MRKCRLQWGGAYWIWEARYPYYASGPAGDWALQVPWFEMFIAQLPLAAARVMQLYKHPGAIFAETAYLWGAPVLDNFAEHCNRTLPPGGGCELLGEPAVPIDSSCDVENPYIKHFFSGSLEVCVMALRRFEHTQNVTDALRYLLPLSDAVLDFYQHHWAWSTNIWGDGVLHLLNSSGCESWPRCDDPAPEVAGLTVLLAGLQALPVAPFAVRLKDFPQRLQRWQAMARMLPPLPLAGGGESLGACNGTHAPQIEGCEGVEMYPVRRGPGSCTQRHPCNHAPLPLPLSHESQHRYFTVG